MRCLLVALPGLFVASCSEGKAPPPLPDSLVTKLLKADAIYLSQFSLHDTGYKEVMQVGLLEPDDPSRSLPQGSVLDEGERKFDTRYPDQNLVIRYDPAIPEDAAGLPGADPKTQAGSTGFKFTKGESYPVYDGKVHFRNDRVPLGSVTSLVEGLARQKGKPAVGPNRSMPPSQKSTSSVRGSED